ncbi:MAG: sugar translocase [Pseudomonadota bacterium]
MLEQGLLVQNRESLRIVSLDKLIPIALSGFCFLLAWWLMGCFNLNFPIGYSGDAFFMSWLTKRLMDGFWYFNSVYSGFPFGSVFYDFPASDSGNFFVLKLLGIFTHSYILTINIYFLLGFSVTSLSSYFILQKLGINKAFSLVGAILFTFLPFHFLRIAHLFYTWYFSIPIFVWFAFKISSEIPIFFESGKIGWKKIKPYLILLALASFGVYYSLFAVLMFIASGIVGTLKWKTSKNIVSALIVIFMVTLGISINIAPNAIYVYKNGINPTVAHRSALESEYYGLKLTQMLLPQQAHRFRFFRDISNHYSQTFPLVTENSTASLGLVGSIGLIILLGVAIGTPFFRFQIDSRIQLLSFLAIFLFLFSTIGGFASIFSLLITPMIRAWNRVSVFIGFASIFTFILCAEKLFTKFISIKFLKLSEICTVIFLIIFGIWDQTGSFTPAYLNTLKNQFLSDRHFVQKIEQLISEGAVYQLPYIAFPEEVINNNFFSYDLFRGYLHSSTLHWNSGGMKGRSGDLFFRKLAEQPLSQQIKTIKTLAFNGIYIDRRGYLDHGLAIEKELAIITGNKVDLVSEDGNLAFFLI